MTSDETYQAIEKLGPAESLLISHGAKGDWFVVEPQVGDSLALRENIRSLLRAGRTVYMIPVADVRRGGDGVIRLWSAPPLDERPPSRRFIDWLKGREAPR